MILAFYTTIVFVFDRSYPSFALARFYNVRSISGGKVLLEKSKRIFLLVNGDEEVGRDMGWSSEDFKYPFYAVASRTHSTDASLVAYRYRSVLNDPSPIVQSRILPSVHNDASSFWASSSSTHFLPRFPVRFVISRRTNCHVV